MIETIKEVQTKKTIKADLERLGVEKGMTLIVHSSLSSLGYVVGGQLTVIKALQEVLTEEGTLVMPTHSSNVSDPKDWVSPRSPRKLWREMRAEMPAYDPAITPSFRVGVIPELFRTLPGVIRSRHPVYSFAAWGKHKEQVIHNQTLDHGLGEDSPIAEIYKLDGHVLMLGTNYNTNTSMHLAEHRTGVFPRIIQSSPILVKGKKVWKKFNEIEYDETAFPRLGTHFETRFLVRNNFIGKSPTKLMSQRELIDFTTENLLRFQV